ncbi:MAG: Rieske 2Fe-2S domain-containing protein [Sphingomonas sp.]
MTDPLVLSAFLDDRPEAGVFRVHSSIFSDAAVFDAEMRYLFEGGWVFLGLECQVPAAHDFLTTTIGRKPVVVMRDGEGVLRAFHNRCPHRGAQLCTLGAGSARVHVCPYHSWSFDSEGRNRAIKGKSEGGYTEAFLAGSHDLAPIAAFGSYRGLMFGSVAADVPPLEDYLGEARVVLDLLLDQSPDGIEALPGTVSYLYRGNWKLQLENCSDAYHVTSVHPTYLRIAGDRAQAAAGAVQERGQHVAELFSREAPAGTFTLDNGHALTWASTPVAPGHALFHRSAELEARFGAARRDWMFYTRNLTLFPNAQFADNFSSQLRVIRPLAPDLTEMTTWCLGPKGEPPAARRQRLREYEDFFNPTGMATPDDNSVYEDCQAAAGGVPDADGWLLGYSRGIGIAADGGNSAADEIGLAPRRASLGTIQLGDETIFHSYYRAWRSRLAAGLAREAAR